MKDFKISTQSFTSRDNICITSYLRDISKFKLLSQEEEARLAALIREGGAEGEKALETLVNANLRFVVTVAKASSGFGVDLSDLISEGNIGLMKAAQSFDETRGNRFLTYAVWWIRQRINAAISQQSGIVRLPSNQYKLLLKYLNMREQMMQKEGRELSSNEFARTEGVEESLMNRILAASGKSQSLDAHVSDDSDLTFLDRIDSGTKTDEAADMESMQADIEDALTKMLNPREQFILRHAFGLGCDPCSLSEIAEMLQLSHERTRQLQKKALKAIRNSSYAPTLISYLTAA